MVEEEEDFNKVVWEEVALLKDLIRDLVVEGLLNTGPLVNMEDDEEYYS